MRGNEKTDGYQADESRRATIPMRGNERLTGGSTCESLVEATIPMRGNELR